MTTRMTNVIPGGGPTTGGAALVYQCAGAPVVAVNDVQTITVDSCTHSTLTLKGLPGGLNYTAAQDVTTAALQTALNTILGTSSVGVTGTYSAGSGGTYIITWSGGTYAGITMPLLTVTATFVGGTSPAVAIVHTTPGVEATFHNVAPPASLLVDTTNMAMYINTGTQQVPVWSNTANTLGGAQAITATSADAFDVGQGGTSNPALEVDTSTATSRTGVKVKSAAAAGGAAISAISSGTDENLTIDAKGAGTLTLQGTATGAVVTGHRVNVTSANANALTAGPNGTTNPSFNVDGSTASSATGINVKSAAAAGGVAVAAISSGTDESLKIDAKGAGTITLNGTATGGVTVARTATFNRPIIHVPSVVAALAMDVTVGKTYTKSIAADSTFTATAGGTAGQELILIISTDGTQRVATFGSNLGSVGTMTIPANKVGVMHWVSNGTQFWEVARAINA